MAALQPSPGTRDQPHQPTAFNTRCVIGDYPPVTLQFVVADYVVHFKHHLSKIDERLK